MIRLCPDNQSGYVVVDRNESRRIVLSTEAKATLNERRQCASLLAMVSDTPIISQLLPCVLLLNERQISLPDFQRLCRRFEQHPHAWPLRLRSSWNDTDLMVWLLEVLRKCLQDVLSQYHICLVLDVCACHVPERVVAKAARCGFALVYIAAGMTSVLQPLDVYVFARFKHALFAAFEWLAHRAPDGHVECISYVSKILEVATHIFFDFDWRWAFLKCGFGQRQNQISESMKQRIPGVVPPAGIPCDLPSLLEMQCIWPRKKDIPIGWLFHWAHQLEDEHPPRPVSEALDRPPAPPANPWLGRLRSSSRLVAQRQS